MIPLSKLDKLEKEDGNEDKKEGEIKGRGNFLRLVVFITGQAKQILLPPSLIL